MNWNTWKKLRNAKLRNAKEDPTLAGHTGLCVLATLSRLATSTAIQRHFLPASLAGRTRMWAHQPCLYCSEAFSSSSICCFEMQRHLRVCAARMGPLPLPQALLLGTRVFLHGRLQAPPQLAPSALPGFSPPQRRATTSVSQILAVSSQSLSLIQVQTRWESHVHTLDMCEACKPRSWLMSTSVVVNYFLL